VRWDGYLHVALVALGFRVVGHLDLSPTGVVPLVSDIAWLATSVVRVCLYLPALTLVQRHARITLRVPRNSMG